MMKGTLSLKQHVLAMVILDRTSHLEKWLSIIGGLISMTAVMLVSHTLVGATGAAMLMGSVGASAVLLFAVPHGALSQPWPLLGGHLVSAFIGVTCARLIPDPALAAALAVALAIGAMHYLNCIHPPGGATALSAVIGGETVHQLGYHYLLMPVLLNIVIVLMIAIAFNYPFHWRRYPLQTFHASRKPESEPDGYLEPDNTPEANSTENDDMSNNKPTSPPSQEDYQQALKSMDSFIDVGVEDLMRLATRAEQFARQRTLTAGSIATLMTQPVVTVRPHTSLAEAARLLVSQRISGLPVVDEQERLAGIITEADFLRILGVPVSHPGHSLWQTLENLFDRLSDHGKLETPDDAVSQHMVRSVITAKPDTPIQQVLNLMKQHQVKRVVIVDDANRVRGMVTRSNLVRLFFDTFLSAPHAR